MVAGPSRRVLASHYAAGSLGCVLHKAFNRAGFLPAVDKHAKQCWLKSFISHANANKGMQSELSLLKALTFFMSYFSYTHLLRIL